MTNRIHIKEVPDMNEVKKPKKSLIFYYGIVLRVILLFNLIAVPWLADRQIKEVDYGTFMKMTETFDHQGCSGSLRKSGLE